MPGTQEHPPSGGEIAEGQFRVVKGEAVVTGLDGRPIGSRKIENGDPGPHRQARAAGRPAEAGFLA